MMPAGSAPVIIFLQMILYSQKLQAREYRGVCRVRSKSRAILAISLHVASYIAGVKTHAGKPIGVHLLKYSRIVP